MSFAMKDLKEVFEDAKKGSYEYVGVAIQMEGYPSKEVIINDYKNFEKKLKYYEEVYDEELNHKHAKGIKITDVVMGDTFDHIEDELVEIY
ncbi:hypothetical protein ACU3L3_07465 [Priestia endophytica]